MRPLTTPVRGCRTSVKVTRRAPVYGDARSGRRHRHLGRATCNEHGKDHTDGSSVSIAHAACEHEPAGPRNALGSGGDAWIGWLEAETVAALDRARSPAQFARQVQEFSRATTGGEANPEAPPGLRGQRRGYEEASPLEVEDRIHVRGMFARARLVVHSSAIILTIPSVPRCIRRGG
jgi:hypothetical protein